MTRMFLHTRCCNNHWKAVDNPEENRMSFVCAKCGRPTGYETYNDGAFKPCCDGSMEVIYHSDDAMLIFMCDKCEKKLLEIPLDLGWPKCGTCSG